MRLSGRGWRSGRVPGSGTPTLSQTPGSLAPARPISAPTKSGRSSRVRRQGPARVSASRTLPASARRSRLELAAPRLRPTLPSGSALPARRDSGAKSRVPAEETAGYTTHVLGGGTWVPGGEHLLRRSAARSHHPEGREVTAVRSPPHPPPRPAEAPGPAPAEATPPACARNGERVGSPPQMEKRGALMGPDALITWFSLPPARPATGGLSCPCPFSLQGSQSTTRGKFASFHHLVILPFKIDSCLQRHPQITQAPNDRPPPRAATFPPPPQFCSLTKPSFAVFSVRSTVVSLSYCKRAVKSHYGALKNK